MINSDKCIIKSSVFFVIGVVSVWYFTTDEGLNVLVRYPIVTLSVLSLIFLYSGSNHGAARGWRDIEIRKRNPEFFEGEDLDV